MFVKHFSIFAFVTGALFLGCNKSPSGPGTIESGNLIGAWVTTSQNITPGLDMGGTVVTDFFATMDACEKDDVMTFAANGTFTSTEGALACDPATNETGTWTLSGSLLTTTEEGAESADSLHITSLSASSISLYMTIPAEEAVDSKAHTITMTAKKQ